MKTLILILLFTLSTLSHANTRCLVSKVSGQGKPVLLMPGFISDETVWQDVATELAKDHQVHQLAIAGFGKNPACNNADDIFNQVVNDVRQYIQSNKLNKPVFVGHSMGGLMAFQLALADDISLGGSIAVDGLPFIGPVFTRDNKTQVSDLAYQAESIKTMYQNAQPAQIKMMTQQGVGIQTKLKDKYQSLIDMAGNSDPTTAGSAIYTVMTTDLRPQLDNLRAPVLLIGAAGGYSEASQQESVKALYQAQLELAPDAELLMNNNGRHFLMWDEPSWLTKTIKQFVKERS